MLKDIPSDKMLQTAMRYGADFAEIFVEETRHTTVICDNNKIEQAQVFFDAGIGIRVMAGERTAYVSTNETGKRGLLALAKLAGKDANAKKALPKPVQLVEKPARAVACVRTHPFGINLGEKCAVASRANEVAWKSGKEIRQVTVTYRDVVRKVCVFTSEGVFTSDEQVGTTFSVQAVAGKDSVLQTGFESAGGSIGFEMFDDTPPEELAEKAARRAIRMLSARPAPAGTMTVILSFEAGGTMIHEAVGHGLEADIAGEGVSVYSKKLGEKVASELITVVDDATLKNRRGSFSFDDEGTPAQRTVLIEKGVLKSYMTDRRSAKHLGLPLTGNARRQNYAQLPIVRMTNTVILPGGNDPQAILADTASGLFVKKMGGGQVTPVNGDFVFEVQEGYLVKYGDICEPVRGATLIGNGPAVLKSIDRVGKDLGFSIGTCGKEGQEAPVASGQPTLRIPELVVGGTG